MGNNKTIRIFFGVEIGLLVLIFLFQILSSYQLTGEVAGTFSALEHYVEIAFICSLTLIMIFFSVDYPSKRKYTITAAIFPIINYIIFYALDTVDTGDAQIFLLVKTVRMVFFGLALHFFNLALKKVDDKLGNPVVYLYAWIRAFIYIIATITYASGGGNKHINNMIKASWWLRLIFLSALIAIFLIQIRHLKKLARDKPAEIVPGAQRATAPVERIIPQVTRQATPVQRDFPKPSEVVKKYQPASKPKPKPQTKTQPQTRTQSASGFRICPVCGHIPSPTDKFCSNCSEEIK